MGRRVAAAAALALLATMSPFAVAFGHAEAVLEKVETLEEQAADETLAPAAVAPLTEEEVAVVDPAGDQPLDDALTCLARTVYWEAKGEDLPGMEAVASVVMNRLASDDFPDTVCAVVTQGRDEGPCQFSWWCDGNPLDVEEEDRYAKTMDVARRALNQELPDRTDGALYFHGEAVSPDWAQTFEPTVTLGGHIFYRPPEDG